MDKKLNDARFSVAFYAGDRKLGALARVRCVAGDVTVTPFPTEAASGLEKNRKPVLVGVSEDGQVILLDPASKTLRFQAAFPADTFPAHIYADPTSARAWFMNDGDKETGNDTLNCGDSGSSVTVIDHIDSRRAEFLKTICVGRGHHQAAFTYPSEQAPQVPRRAYISSLNDGTISVIGNDPADASTYLRVIDTVNLCEPDKEEAAEATVPNKAYPHGLAYSPITGKLYNLNNGYGTLAVIDPVSNRIEERLPFKGYSNAFASPCGRYLIGRGADRKSDPHHVIGKLGVWDAVSRSFADKLDLPDVYLSKYYYNTEGGKLYFTTGSSGSAEQQRHLKTDVLLVLDMAALPKLTLLKEVKVGTAGSLAFHDQAGRSHWVFVSDSEGELVVLDAERDEVVERIAVTSGPTHSRVWSLRE